MDPLIIYHKPTCTTCRQVIKLVQASGTPYKAINYYEEPFTKASLKRVLELAGLKAQDVMRTKEEVYKRLKTRITALKTEDELIDLMLQHPDLIQRPLVVTGKKAILARPPETITSFLMKP